MCSSVLRYALCAHLLSPLMVRVSITVLYLSPQHLMTLLTWYHHTGSWKQMWVFERILWGYADVWYTVRQYILTGTTVYWIRYTIYDYYYSCIVAWSLWYSLVHYVCHTTAFCIIPGHHQCNSWISLLRECMRPQHMSVAIIVIIV